MQNTGNVICPAVHFNSRSRTARPHGAFITVVRKERGADDREAEAAARETLRGFNEIKMTFFWRDAPQESDADRAGLC